MHCFFLISYDIAQGNGISIKFDMGDRYGLEKRKRNVQSDG